MEKIVDGIEEIFNESGILQHLWVFVISFIAGVVGHFERMQSKQGSRFIFMILIYDLVTSSFMGLLALYACLAAAIDIYTIGVIVGVAAHSGTKGLSSILKLIAGKYKVSVKIDAEGKNENSHTL